MRKEDYKRILLSEIKQRPHYFTTAVLGLFDAVRRREEPGKSRITDDEARLLQGSVEGYAEYITSISTQGAGSAGKISLDKLMREMTSAYRPTTAEDALNERIRLIHSITPKDVETLFMAISILAPESIEIVKDKLIEFLFYNSQTTELSRAGEGVDESIAELIKWLSEKTGECITAYAQKLFTDKGVSLEDLPEGFRRAYEEQLKRLYQQYKYAVKESAEQIVKRGTGVTEQVTARLIDSYASRFVIGEFVKNINRVFENLSSQKEKDARQGFTADETAMLAGYVKGFQKYLHDVNMIGNSVLDSPGREVEILDVERIRATDKHRTDAARQWIEIRMRRMAAVTPVLLFVLREILALMPPNMIEETSNNLINFKEKNEYLDIYKRRKALAAETVEAINYLKQNKKDALSTAGLHLLETRGATVYDIPLEFGNKYSDDLMKNYYTAEFAKAVANTLTKIAQYHALAFRR